MFGKRDSGLSVGTVQFVREYSRCSWQQEEVWVEDFWRRGGRAWCGVVYCSVVGVVEWSEVTVMLVGGRRWTTRVWIADG